MKGAKLLSGGVSDNKQKGFYAKPTLFDGLKKENMTIAQNIIGRNIWTSAWCFNS